MVKLNEVVAAFSLPATGDQTLSLSDFAGKNLVIYFYPKDNTPGCIKEGQAFRDLYPELQKLNTAVLGVSRDSVRVHEGFRAKQQFPFDLLSDKEELLCKQFDVIKLKKNYGREYMGIERSTFLIDGAGRLLHEWRKVKVAGHAEEVLEALRKL
ncbi:MAG: peroxiredoxin [Candidatus Polarisedimenticolaceae bacterium]|nr:peroxiredoxin [Candidatus Polarisedimenticolaceae bacterium]